MNNMIIVILPFEGGASKVMGQEVRNAYQVMKHSSSKLIFCVNNRLEKSEILKDNNLSKVDMIATRRKTIPS